MTDQQVPLVSIEGEKVALGPINRGLLPLVAKWRNDFDVTRMFGPNWRITSWKAAEAWLERAINSDDVVTFTIYERATMRPIGFSRLSEIDRVDRTASFTIAVGERDCWGKGYATEATALTLDYGFSWLNLHNIRLHVYSYNARATTIYERIGFKVIGRWREAHNLGNRMHDVILMDCLSTEFQSPVLHRYLPTP